MTSIPQQQPQPLSDGSRKKIVYFVRHAEALHNVKERQAMEQVLSAAGTECDTSDNDRTLLKARAEEARRCILRDDASLRDAPLSAHGTVQARLSKERMSALFGGHHSVFRQPGVVLVSPLRRALMTAMELFSNNTDDGPRFVAMEALREKRTGLDCDERSSVDELQREFPLVDFSDVKANGNTIPIGEDNSAVRQRAISFMDHRLPHMDCTHVAIVTHKGWLREMRKMLKSRADAGTIRTDFDLNQWDTTLYGNAEIRVSAMRWQDGELMSVVSRSVDNAINQSLAMSGDGFEFALGPPSSGFSIFLANRTTKVHFITVSEGQHNAAIQQKVKAEMSNGQALITVEAYTEQMLLRENGRPASEHPLHDSRLSRPKGTDQALHLQKILANRPSGGRPFTAFETVIVSPLTRACEVAQIVFADSPGTYGGEVVPPPHVLVKEECRERYGKYVCDGRRSVSELQKEFPTFDFSEMTSNHDVLHGDERETSAQCRDRALRLLQWLSDRPERCIAVVTHSDFLRHLFGQFGDTLEDQDRSLLQRMATHCELRSVVLCSHGSSHSAATKNAPASTVRVPSIGYLAAMYDDESSPTSVAVEGPGKYEDSAVEDTPLQPIL